jgi:hypothetical protein
MYLYLTTTGRVTGQPREIEIWFSHWIERNSLVAGAGIAAMMIGAILFMPNWMQDWWYASSGYRKYLLIPLSEMKWEEWVCALMGAGIYVLAYGAFQQWLTGGRWLEHMKRKLTGEA